MPNPTLPISVGIPSPIWANDINNWRAEDASWLLARSNIRFASTAEWFASPIFSRGGIAFLDGTEELAVAAGASSASYILHGKNLKRSDDGILHRSSGSSVRWSSTEVEVLPALKITGTDGIAKYTGATLSLNTDAVTLTTTGATTQLTSTRPVVITAGTLTTITNGLSVGGTLAVAGAATFTSGVTAPTFTGSLVSAYITSGTAKFGNYEFAANSFKNITGPPLLDFTGQNAEVRANKVTLKVAPGQAVLDDGSTSQAGLAGVKVATVAPVNGTDNYPLGTIWVRV